MSEHVVPVRLYLAIYVLLMAFTALTVRSAYLDLGALNVVIMLTIAVTKAVLVVLYFMHVRYSPGLTQVTVASGVLFLVLLIGLTMSDVLTRASPHGF